MPNTYSTKSGKAYYWNTIPEFINDDAKTILGTLVRHSFNDNTDQTQAWDNQITELQKRLYNNGIDGDIIFEYDIVRLGKRIDVILLIKHMVFSLEFKNGAKEFKAADAQQAEDYALDIKNFHKESENLYVCPILIATNAPNYSKEQLLDCYSDKQVYLQRENINTLFPKVNIITNKYGSEERIDFDRWFNSPYYPTPTIISAAVQAYKTHDLSEIAKSEAGQENIDACEKKVFEIIEYAKNKNKKCVCFVTGVPGAGKTLVGLDIVSKHLDKGKNNLSVYLSGNGALVEVLRKALKNSVKQSNKALSPREKKEAEIGIEHLIESSFHYKKQYASNTLCTPEHIIIFDEAQRVWNKEKMMQKHNKDQYMSVSEPSLFYRIMNKRQDWAVMVCLVGLGQDIYDGEVGINEWFRCGIEDYNDWELFYSPDIFSQSEDRTINQRIIESCNRCYPCYELHLKTSIRSFRAEKQCEFVDALLDNNPNKARETYSLLSPKYPILLTRKYETAKKWVWSQVRGSQRCGVLACSSAQRLKPEGIYVHTDIDVNNWFLAPTDDLRSSNMLEIVASEFKVQGLEIDWSVVCWDADLRRNTQNSDWEYYSFRGTNWQRRKKEEQQRYLINSYRVLLTRARQGMIIFVPKGVDEDEDPTRNSSFYDGIYDYLISCGIKEI